MTYSNTYNSYTLAGDDGGYSWATEGWDASAFAGMTLQECAEESHKEAHIQLQLAIEIVQADFLNAAECNGEGEPLIRNRTLSEIVEELTDDVPFLESYLYRWMVEAGLPQDDPTEGGSEPFPQAISDGNQQYIITNDMMGDWDAPATIAEISADVAMNWHTAGVEYRVEAHGDNVYIYALDSSSESNSRNWHGWLYLGFGEYRLEIGELYQDQAEEDEEEHQPFGVETAIKLIRSGHITQTDGLTWHNHNGDEITVSLDIERDSLYEIITDPYRFGNISRSLCTEYALIEMISGNHDTDFYWVTMENNAWAVAHAPQVDTETLLPPIKKHYRLFTGEVHTNLNPIRNAQVKGTWVYRVYESPNWTFGEEYYPIGRVQLFPTNLIKALQLVVGTKALQLLANVEKAVGAFPKDLQSQWREYQRVRATVRVAVADTVASWREGEWSADEDDLIDMIDNIFYHNL